MGSIDRPPPPITSRKGEAYAFICDELAHGRRSPSLPEIGRQLNISLTRAKQLVKQLVDGGWISREAGAQRAIHVPGAARALAIGILRAEGFTVDEDSLEIGSGGFPKLQLPTFPDLVHIPEEFGGDGDGVDGSDLRKRA